MYLLKFEKENNRIESRNLHNRVMSRFFLVNYVTSEAKNIIARKSRDITKIGLNFTTELNFYKPTSFNKLHM